MINWLKKYWPEILTFSGISVAILACLSPALTWLFVDSDGPEYVMDAINFYPAHHTSAPLYLLMGHVFELLPFGSEYWRMSLMSGVFTVATCIFIYLIVRKIINDRNKGNIENAGSKSALVIKYSAYNKRNHGRWYGLLAAVIFGGAMLVFAQAIIVETYAVVTFFSVAAYYFTLKKNWYMVSIMLGCGLVTHHLILLTWLVLFVAHKELRHWKTFGLSAAFLIFYIYIPLSVHFTDQPNMWGNTGFADFFKNNIGVFTMLVGQLPIYEFPTRIFSVAGILGVSFGIACIPISIWLWKHHGVKSVLLWLFVLPIIYMSADLAPQVAKYMEATIAWGAIMAVIALSELSKPVLKKVLIYGTTISAVVMLGINANAFDIGRTIDPNLSAQKFYDEELTKLKDGDIFVTNGAWEWIEVFMYNKETGHKLIPVCMGILPSERYRTLLREQGVVIEELDQIKEYQDYAGSHTHTLNAQQVYFSLSIVENNPNVYTSKSTDPSTYGAEIVLAKDNTDQFTRWLGHDVVVPKWNFMPTAPYSYVTGDIEVEKWVFILQSNRTVIWFATLLGLGWILAWGILKMRPKKISKTEIIQPKED
jgi:hypothetical protein